MDKEQKADGDILAFNRVFNSEDGERVLKRLKSMAKMDDYSLPINVCNDTTRYLFMARSFVNFIIAMKDSNPNQEARQSAQEEYINEL